MRIHDLEQPANRPPASATRMRHPRAVLLGAGALALALATIGIMAALAGRSSLATQARAPSVNVADPSSVAAASAATQQSRRGQVASTSTTSTPPVLADGTYPTYLDEVDVDGATITIDRIQVFENEAAVNAAIEDGMARGEAQYLYIYVRNQNPRLRTLPVARDVRIEFVDGCEAPPNRDAALSELAKKKSFDKLYYYDVTVANGAIHQITQHLAKAAC